MKTEPIVPARIEFRDGVPFAPEFGDAYHPRVGAFAQARDVFMTGNDLPARWRGRERFVILETGFGLGNNFLATWGAWREDEQRSQRLIFVSIEKHPPTAGDLALAHAASPAPALAAQLTAAWPPATPGLHVLEFESGRVTLLLALGDVALWLPELQAQVDAIYLDGFAPARNAPTWDARTLRALGRLAAPGATAATWSTARSVHDALSAATFRVQQMPGVAGKFDMTLAQVEASITERRRGAPPGRLPALQARQALVVGAGLAGAAAAHALARQGLEVTVLDAAEHAASGASGNPAGLFHGVVHAHDGTHAQLLRAAALRAEQVYRPLIESGHVPGALQGLLRGGGETLAALQAMVDAQRLPATYAEAFSQDTASAAAGCPLAGAAWRFAGGGWLQPAALVHAWLQEPGIRLRTGVRVDHLQPLPNGRWQALGEHAALLGEADVVVVAAAHATPTLLAVHSDASSWPWRHTRGQLTIVRAAEAESLPRPTLPIASGGYLLALPEALGGGLLCGATSHTQDNDCSIRDTDHRANLAQLAALTGMAVDVPECWFGPNSGVLDGRVAWRLGCDDRLPVVGSVPLPAAALEGLKRLEQPRHVPRVQGLYVLAGLGSRGITWAPLLGEVLAAGITGAPLPLAGSLLDAIDPARFLARLRRQATG